MGRHEEAIERHGFRFKHSLGQNFIFDEALLDRLAEAAGVTAQDDVLEIGPGSGTLTARLAARAHRVLALELDRSLIPVLQDALAGRGNVTLVQGDATRADLCGLAAQAFGEGRPFLVVANLPYYVTTPVLTRLLTEGLPVARIAVMVQREVGEKLMAQPGDAAYCLLSALCAWHAKAREALAVPAAYFIPRPKVDSSFMVLDMREQPPVPEADAGLTMRVARAAFAMRRKTMLNNLQPAFGLTREQAQACLEAAGIEPAARGETLSVQAFAAIAQALAQIKKI